MFTPSHSSLEQSYPFPITPVVPLRPLDTTFAGLKRQLAWELQQITRHFTRRHYGIEIIILAIPTGRGDEYVSNAQLQVGEK